MKSALITGATDSLGCAIATAIAGVGWRAFALGQNRRLLDEMKAVPGVTPLAIDVADREALRSLTADIDFGAIIHVVGFPFAEITNLPLDERVIDSVLETTLSTTIHLSAHTIARLASKGSGQVIFVLPEPHEPGPSRHSVQAAALAGVRAFAQQFAYDAAFDGISVDIVDVPPGLDTNQGSPKAVSAALIVSKVAAILAGQLSAPATINAASSGVLSGAGVRPDLNR